MNKIGFRHSQYKCPWCEKTFGYNCYSFTDREIAHSEWKVHIDENHKEEYNKLINTKEKRIDIQAIMDLQIGILPEERKKKTLDGLKKEIKRREKELEELKKQKGELDEN